MHPSISPLVTNRFKIPVGTAACALPTFSGAVDASPSPVSTCCLPRKVLICSSGGNCALVWEVFAHAAARLQLSQPVLLVGAHDRYEAKSGERT